MLTVVVLAGSGPTMLLRRVAPWSVRFALAPVVGFSVTTCVFATTSWFFPASETFWLIPIIIVASVGWASWLNRRTVNVPESATVTQAHGPTKRRVLVGIAQCLTIAILVSAPITTTLVEAHSIGPVTYQVFDADAYLAIQDGLQHQSLDGARVLRSANSNLVQNLFSSLADTSQETEMSPLAANLNELLGLSATDTQSAFLIVVLVIGGLAAFAAICLAVGTATWWAVFGGCLFGGAFFMQLFFDGSEGALCGLAVLVPLGVVSLFVARERQRSMLIVPAILLGALYALYPAFLSIAGATAVVAIFGGVLRSGAYRRSRWGALLVGGGELAATILLSIGIDIVGFIRAWQTWIHILGTQFGSLGFPAYHLTWKMLPGWLIQTTGFYSFATTEIPAVSIVAAVVVPLLILLIFVPGLRRNPFAWLALPAIVTVLVGAHHQVVAQSCSYCEDRNLLPMSVLLIFVVGLGVATLAIRHPRITLVAMLAAASTIAFSAYNERERYAASAYMLPSSLRSAIVAMPHTGVVDLEAFDAGPGAPGEFALVYDLTYEVTGNRVSAPADVLGDPGLAYLYIHPLDGTVGEIFDPDYSYVVTAIPGVRTGRRTILSGPGFAIERRSDPLDVTLDGGEGVNPPAVSDGSAFVTGDSLRFIVSGPAAHPPTVRFEVALPAGMTAAATAEIGEIGPIMKTQLTDSGCLKTTPVPRVTSIYSSKGVGGIYTATVSLPGNIGIRIVSMSASSGACPTQH
jgi:hypothetical protein